jgi:integrase
MANVKIILYKSKKLKNGNYPVVLRVTHERKRKYITLGEGNQGFACSPNQWDNETSRFKKNYPDRKSLNQILLNIEQQANEIVLRFFLDKEEFTFDKFERSFGRSKNKDDLKTIFTEEIHRLEKAGRVGYARVFQSTLNALMNFSEQKELRLRDIGYKFLVDFESSLLGKQDRKNTVSVYMRTLRTLFNTAIKLGYLKEAHYPFRSRNNPNGYSLKRLKQETMPRAMTKEDLKKLKNFKLDNDTTMFDDLNFFIFSYYCKGINFHDLANLKWTNIQNGRLKYTRAKTGGQLDMELLEPAKEIIDYYRKCKRSEYIFPILNNELKDAMEKYKRIKNGLKRFNKNLKKICKMLEIEPVTSYVSRHTWATIMKQKGISIEIISESMDHKTVAQTSTYLKKLNKDILDHANKAVLL